MQDMREQYVNRMRAKAEEKRKNWLNRRTIDGVLQIGVIAGSVSVPVLLNIPEVSKLLLTIVSIFVAICAGILKYFRFDEWGRIQRSTSLQLDSELEDYGLETGPYKGMEKDEAFHLFRQRTALILSEHTKLVNALHEPPQPAQQKEIRPEEPASA